MQMTIGFLTQFGGQLICAACGEVSDCSSEWIPIGPYRGGQDISGLYPCSECGKVLDQRVFMSPEEYIRHEVKELALKHKVSVNVARGLIDSEEAIKDWESLRAVYRCVVLYEEEKKRKEISKRA